LRSIVVTLANRVNSFLCVGRTVREGERERERESMWKKTIHLSSIVVTLANRVNQFLCVGESV